ncbi:hypothetical protein ACTHGU_22005 [Chitinophagaceae bacterium MMS25-I14]
MQRKLLIIALVCCSFLAFAQKHKSKKTNDTAHVQQPADTAKMNYREIGAPMPPVKMVTMKGKTITAADLKNDVNLFVMLFNPTCEHCEEETEILKKNIFLFKKNKLVLMAGSMMMPYLEYFNNNHQVSEYPTMIVGVDSSHFVDNAFLYQGLPQINIYNKERKLIKIFSTDVPIDSLKPFIDGANPELRN